MKLDLMQKIRTNGFVILDGASGTMMQALGMPTGECAEKYIINNPSSLAQLQRAYYEAGSDVVYTYTFGANSSKLKNYGISTEEAYNINLKLAKISCEVRDEMQKKFTDRKFLVAGGMAPTGEFLQPAGDMEFDELKNIYKNQAKALGESGVDLFVVETMMDLLSTKAAVLGIKEVSDLPIMVSMTYENMRTLSGNTPQACLVALAALGISAFGANCSTGPEGMEEVIISLANISDIPIIAKPNAGMPIEVDNRTVFPMEPAQFAKAVERLFSAGAKVLGGCCGTTPEHIERLKHKLNSLQENGLELKLNDSFTDEFISSGSDITRISPETVYVTVRPDDPATLIDAIMDASEKEPDCIVLDFNSIENGDIKTFEFKEELAFAALSVKIPLGICTLNSGLLEELGKVYPGRLALKNSDSKNSQEILDVASRYGIKVV